MTEWTKEEQKNHRQLWIKALRSGGYDQTIGTLRTNDGFCCLGVACDISGLGEFLLDGLKNQMAFITVDGDSATSEPKGLIEE